MYFQTEGSRTEASRPSKCRSSSGSKTIQSVVNATCDIRNETPPLLLSRPETKLYQEYSVSHPLGQIFESKQFRPIDGQTGTNCC